MALFTIGTGWHYITMLPVDWSISTSHDPLPSSERMLWNPIYMGSQSQIAALIIPSVVTIHVGVPIPRWGPQVIIHSFIHLRKGVPLASRSVLGIILYATVLLDVGKPFPYSGPCHWEVTWRGRGWIRKVMCGILPGLPPQGNLFAHCWFVWISESVEGTRMEPQR